MPLILLRGAQSQRMTRRLVLYVHGISSSTNYELSAWISRNVTSILITFKFLRRSAHCQVARTSALAYEHTD